jgi:hypothetical protein
MQNVAQAEYALITMSSLNSYDKHVLNYMEYGIAYGNSFRGRRTEFLFIRVMYNHFAAIACSHVFPYPPPGEKGPLALVGIFVSKLLLI